MGNAIGTFCKKKWYPFASCPWQDTIVIFRFPSTLDVLLQNACWTCLQTTLLLFVTNTPVRFQRTLLANVENLLHLAVTNISMTCFQ